MVTDPGGRYFVPCFLEKVVKPYNEELWKFAEETFPKAAKMLYPRQYENIGGYHSPKEVALGLISATLHTLSSKKFSDAPMIDRLILPGLAETIKRKMPLMFVSPKLLEAVKNTKFEAGVEWNNLKLPYEQGIFVLPQGGLVSAEHGDAAFIIYTRTREGDHVSPFPDRIIEIYSDTTHFSFAAFHPSDGVWIYGNLPLKTAPVIQYDYAFDESAPAIINAHTDYALEKNDRNLLNRVGQITFGILMSMNARPDLIVRESLIKRTTTKNGVREFWSPNIIGRDYRVAERREGSGHHASPRWHWVRGHYRMQVHGPRNTLRKTIWIEPYLVTGESE